MHYQNGKEAKENDHVIFKDYDGVKAGTLNKLNALATSCNGLATFAVIGGVEGRAVTIGDCYLAADAFAAIELQMAAGAPAAPAPKFL